MFWLLLAKVANDRYHSPVLRAKERNCLAQRISWRLTHIYEKCVRERTLLIPSILLPLCQNISPNELVNSSRLFAPHAFWFGPKNESLCIIVVAAAAALAAEIPYRVHMGSSNTYVPNVPFICSWLNLYATIKAFTIPNAHSTLIVRCPTL